MTFGQREQRVNQQINVAGGVYLTIQERYPSLKDTVHDVGATIARVPQEFVEPAQ